MSIDVGDRLRFVRSRNKLSQRELAKRSGVTNSTISLIESNQMNPSVGALKRILDGIPMGMAEFFALEPDRPRKAFYRSDELSEIGKGPISFRQVGDNLFGRTLQILKERYEPGGDTGRIPLVHDGEEGGIILSGRLEVTVDSERRILGPGDAYYFESRRPHRFRCVGAKACSSARAHRRRSETSSLSRRLRQHNARTKKVVPDKKKQSATPLVQPPLCGQQTTFESGLSACATVINSKPP